MPSFLPNLIVSAISYANMELPTSPCEETVLWAILKKVMLDHTIAQVALSTSVGFFYYCEGRSIQECKNIWWCKCLKTMMHACMRAFYHLFHSFWPSYKNSVCPFESKTFKHVLICTLNGISNWPAFLCPYWILHLWCTFSPGPHSVIGFYGEGISVLGFLFFLLKVENFKVNLNSRIKM